MVDGSEAEVGPGEAAAIPPDPGSYSAADAGIAGRMSVSITIAVAGRAK